jgi:hypothetical protein
LSFPGADCDRERVHFGVITELRPAQAQPFALAVW